jgi:ABC-type enterochelin transport system permease subunit
MARFRFSRRRSHASGSLLSYFVPRLVVLLLFSLLLYYLLKKQRQNFSQVRLPSGILPPLA